jgi:hypothetical protein
MSVKKIISSLGQEESANGTINISSRFINSSISVGYQFSSRKKTTCLQLLANMNYAFGLGEYHQKGEVRKSVTNEDIVVDTKGIKIPSDFRPGLLINFQKNRLVYSVGYWRGIKNYLTNPNGTNFEVYSNLFKAGIYYEIGKLL